MRQTKNRKSDHRGQALVEFALVLPVLIVLAVLVVQYGIIYRTAAELTNLSREGARFAATSPATNQPILDRIALVTPSDLNPSDITTTITPAPGDPARASGSGGNITVTISYNMSNKLFMPLPSTFMGVHIFVQTYTVSSTFAVE